MKPRAGSHAGPRALITEVRIEFKGDLAVDALSARAHRSLRVAWPLLRAIRSARRPGRKPKRINIQCVAGHYAAAVIDQSKAEVDPVSARVRLLVIVDSGPAFHYGNIVIKGLNRYDPKLVNNLAPFKAVTLTGGIRSSFPDKTSESGSIRFGPGQC